MRTAEESGIDQSVTNKFPGSTAGMIDAVLLRLAEETDEVQSMAQR